MSVTLWLPRNNHDVKYLLEPNFNRNIDLKGIKKPYSNQKSFNMFKTSLTYSRTEVSECT